MLRSRLSLLLVFLVAAVPSPAYAEKPFRYAEGKHKKGELKYVNGIPVLTVEGTGAEIGEQIGALALKQTKPVFNSFKDQFLKRQGLDKLWPVVVKACNAMIKKVPEEHVQELEAMAKAAGVDR